MKLATAIFGNSSWYVTSPFGPRTHPTKKTKDHHNGTDYGTGGKKLPQYALEDGKVLRASVGTNSGWGNLVEVDYPRIGKLSRQQRLCARVWRNCSSACHAVYRSLSPLRQRTALMVRRRRGRYSAPLSQNK